MSALKRLKKKNGGAMTDAEFCIVIAAKEIPAHAEKAAAEFEAMRQLIGEQTECIQQQQAVMDAAEVAVHEANNPYATARDIINAIDALAAALAALPQPATKGTP
jgi:hypothetical protein